MNFPVLDWVILAVLVISLLLGAWRGFVYEVLTLASWIVAFALAQKFAADIAAKLPMSQSNEALRYGVAFILIFVASVLLCGMLASFLKSLLSSTGMGGADRSLGAVFGLLRGVVLMLVATTLISMTGFKTSPLWKESQGATLLTMTLLSLKPLLPQDLGKYLPTPNADTLPASGASSTAKPKAL